MNTDAPEPLYLGVDGGGTKTRAVVVDSAGVERGAATTGCSNYKVVGELVAIQQLLAAAREAGRAAGAEPPFPAAWVGLAGMDGAADLALISPQVRSLAGVVRLSNDAELLLTALPCQVGIALIAGTGSIAVGRGVSGEVARVGGWGHLVGDEGSGYELGLRGLIAALRAGDGRDPATLLYDRILSAWDATSAEEIADLVYREERKGSIAQLAPLVLRAARDGDAAARRITRRATRELAELAVTLGHRLAFDTTPAPIALGGSLLLRVPDFREAVLRAIRRRLPLGEVALVEQPALSAARAAISLDPAAATTKEHPSHDR